MGLRLTLFTLVWWFSLSARGNADPAEHYRETLNLTQLQNGMVLAVFEFDREVHLDLSLKQKQHYRLFPRAFGDIVHSFEVRELQLSFTQGRWDYDRWGFSRHSGGSGVELWASFEANSSQVDTQWKGLTNALSGLFCASLNFLDKTVTTTPSWIKLDEGSTARYGFLPREIVCTENLTPWTKQLPCQSKSGIGALLNAYKLYDANFHSMKTQMEVCKLPSCPKNNVRLTQTLAVVLDPVRFTGRRDWSIQDLFAKSLDNRCPLATDTQLAVILPKSNGLAFGVQPHGLKHDKDEEGNDVEVGTYRWELLNSDMASRLGISGAADLKFQSRSAFHAHRFVTGYGQERGGITVTLANRQANSSVQALLYQPIPWFMKMYMHTLRITNPNGEVTVRDMHFRPAVDRSHSNVMELHLELPPHSVSEISIDFDKAFIKYTEHPPDANRGFDVGSAVVFVLGANDTERDTANTCDFMKANCRKYYTETLLISLPTPDFSMPYNVITLTCTLLALLFGSMFNLMTRNFTQISIKNQK